MGGYKPLLCVHWYRAKWMAGICSTVSKRLILVYGFEGIGKAFKR